MEEKDEGKVKELQERRKEGRRVEGRRGRSLVLVMVWSHRSEFLL